MPNAPKRSKARNVTTGDVLDDLGLSPEETIELKVKTDLWRDLIAHIERRGLNQAALKKALKVHQPDVSNFLRGKLSKFSTGKLIQFAVGLKIGVEIRTIPPKNRKRVAAAISDNKSRQRDREMVHS